MQTAAWKRASRSNRQHGEGSERGVQAHGQGNRAESAQGISPDLRLMTVCLQEIPVIKREASENKVWPAPLAPRFTLSKAKPIRGKHVTSHQKDPETLSAGPGPTPVPSLLS